MANDFVIPDRRGLVAEFLLNGNANDTSGNGYDGTPLNVTYSKTSRGYQTYSGNFNWGNSQIERTWFTSMDALNVWTYQMVIRIAWVWQGAWFALQWLDNNTEKTWFMGWDSLWQCAIWFFFGWADLWTFATVPYNTTVHVVWVKTATTASIYVNWVLASSVANSRTTTNTTTFRRFNIWKHYWASGNANRFNGSIQSVRIFNRALSETEIRNWYLESLRALGGSSLAWLTDWVVAYYDFRGDANDIIGGYDGTVNGATLTTDRFGNANSAYSFTWGNNIYVGNGTLINNGSNTVSLWVRMDSLSHTILVVRWGFSVDWWFSIGYHSTTWFSFWTHTAPTNNSISSNFHPNVWEWNHVCAVFNSSSGYMQLYINWTSYGSISCWTTLRSNWTIGWTFGNWNSPATYPLVWWLSDVEIRFTPITANQVKAIYELSRQSKLLPFE